MSEAPRTKARFVSSGPQFGTVISLVEIERLVALDRDAIRLPSHSYQEHELAAFYAECLSAIGFEVSLMDVVDPTDPTRRSCQPVARLKGTGGGPTLMLNGHMDTIGIASGWTVDPYAGKLEDGWIWGVGAHDDKGGLAAAIAAVEAIVRSGTRLKGDVLLCPVAAHKMGGIGTRTLLAAGIRADCCINLEHSANTIATNVVGRIEARVVTRNTGLFFRYSAQAKAAYCNAIEQQAALIDRLGPSLDPVQPGTWMTFTPDPDLPGFPMHRFNSIHKEMYPRECEMMMEVRTVPEQTPERLRADLAAVLDAIKEEQPALDYELTVPAGGSDDVRNTPPMRIAKDHPMVVALVEGQRLASGREPVVGGGLRIGNVGDGNVIAAHGIPTLQYGPGDIRNYPEWPGPDERVEVRELLESACALAYAILKVCG